MRIIKLGIDRGPSHIAVIGPQMRPQSRKINEAVDLAKKVIGRDMPLEAEAVEQRLLHHPPLAHHRRISSTQEKGISVQRPNQAEFFNAIRRHRS